MPNARDLSNEGNVFFKQQNYQAALEKYEAAIVLNPRLDVAWSNKGIAHAKLKQYAEALDAFERTLSINPTHVVAMQNIKSIFAFLNKTAAEKHAQSTAKIYTETVLRPFVCKQTYFEELKCLQEKVAGAKDFAFMEQVNLVLELINFLQKYYQRHTRPYEFILKDLSDPSEKGRRLRLRQIANNLILEAPMIFKPGTSQLDEVSLKALNTVQEDIFFEDAKRILRAIFTVFYFFSREERGKITKKLPWGENSWYMLEFCGAVFAEDSTIDRVNAQGAISLISYSFGGDKALQKQFIYFTRSLLDHMIITKISIVDIIQHDIPVLQSFFQELSCHYPSATSDSLKMGDLPHLKAILWYSKHLFNTKRLLCLLPRISDDLSLLDESLMPEMGIKGGMNIDQEIDMVEFFKAKPLRKNLPEGMKAFVPYFLASIQRDMPTLKVKDLINLGLLGESTVGSYGIKAPTDTDRVFAISDFVAGPITPSKRLQLATATNYLNLNTLKGRLALLRKIQLIGEFLTARHWGNLRKYIDYINADKLADIRNGLVHFEEGGCATVVQQLETDKTLLNTFFIELQLFTEKFYQEIAKWQASFEEWPTKRFDAGHEVWQDFAAKYWTTVKGFYLKNSNIDAANFCPNIPLTTAAEKAQLLRFTKTDQVEVMQKILEGKIAFPKKGVLSMLNSFADKPTKKALKRILDAASEKYNAIKKEAIEEEKRKNTEENQLREVRVTTVMTKDYPAINQTSSEFFRAAKLPPKDKVEVFNLLKNRLKLLEDLLVESKVDFSSKATLHTTLAVLLDRDVALLLSTGYLLGQIIGTLNKLYVLADISVFPNLEARLLDYVALRNALEHTDPILESIDLPMYEWVSSIPEMMLSIVKELFFDYKALFFSVDPLKFPPPSTQRSSIQQEAAVDPIKFLLQQPQIEAQDSSSVKLTSFFFKLNLNERSQVLAGLNNSGDDKNLKDDGDDPKYIYRVRDVVNLMLAVRCECLHYQDAGTGLEYQQPGGEDYSQLRENAEHIFLTDPIHELHFCTYLLDEIKKISGQHEEAAMHKQKWQKPPTTLILPILTGRTQSGHWQNIRVTIDYQQRQANILWDDPYGQGRFYEETKTGYRRAITEALAILFKTFTNIDALPILQESDKQINQQGDDNSWDCGPIIVSNIRDYVEQAQLSNAAFAADASPPYSIAEASQAGHAEKMLALRAIHRDTYQKTVEERIEGPLNLSI
ncbi:MAG: hypothetical protein K0S08_1014 [Gammaproteobacteria bacterium]|jgi:tetratricopeptide (TPR) repeat protein|nr:hypothetical protein [Gammaproteobacteria bacterium]